MAIVLFLLLLTLSQAQNLTTNYITLSITNTALNMMTQYTISCVNATTPAASCADTTGDLPAWWVDTFDDSLLPPVSGDKNYVFTGIVWDTTSNVEPYGVVAVNSVTKSVYLAFHGTITNFDFGADANILFTPYESQSGSSCSISGNVHKGWNNLYANISDNIYNLLKPTFNTEYTLYISGHSLGASLSNFAMADYYCNHRSSYADIILYNSAAPNIGDLSFQTTWKANIPEDKTYSLTNHNDPIPLAPKKTPAGLKYYPVGTRVYYSVNWHPGIFNCQSPNTEFCTVNHDPKCVYYYAVSQLVASSSAPNSCDCAADNQCGLCIPSLGLYNHGDIDGCPILNTTNPTAKKVEL